MVISDKIFEMLLFISTNVTINWIMLTFCLTQKGVMLPVFVAKSDVSGSRLLYHHIILQCLNSEWPFGQPKK